MRLKRTPEERARRREKRRKRDNDVDEMRFREKMWSALEDDERLDGLNARFNDYHVPDRWSRDEHDLANPQYMDDDEYAEWIREGMWKKKHAREYQEQVRRDAEKSARKARQRAIRTESSRLHKLALEQEEVRRKEREDEHRQRYEQRWKTLLGHRQGTLMFRDIPWPLFHTDPVCMEDITPEAIAAFLLPDTNVPDDGDNIARKNREKLKETLLRFHPDKFEGRLMHRIPPGDVEKVREAVGQVARSLNTLMNDKSR